MNKLISMSILSFSTTISLLASDCLMVKDLNVQFKNASTIYYDSSEYDKVKEFSSFLKETDLYAVIEGHTNPLSNASYNYELSNERAMKVRNELVSLGVDSKKVKYIAYGESSPLYDNSTEDGLQKNRRVIAEVFNTEDELNKYISSEKERISNIKYTEQ